MAKSKRKVPVTTTLMPPLVSPKLGLICDTVGASYRKLVLQTEAEFKEGRGNEATQPQSMRAE